MIEVRQTRRLVDMVQRLAAALAIAITSFGSVAFGQAPPPRIVDLQRLVFEIGDPAFPDTPERLEAQLTLAQAYVAGTGVEQSHRADGTVGDRSLEWHVLEFRAAKGDLNRVDGVGVVVEPRQSLWPPPPVPDTVRGGASFRMLTNGQVRWRFEGAPELGTGTIDPEVN